MCFSAIFFFSPFFQLIITLRIIGFLCMNHIISSFISIKRHEKFFLEQISISIATIQFSESKNSKTMDSAASTKIIFVSRSNGNEYCESNDRHKFKCSIESFNKLNICVVYVGVRESHRWKMENSQLNTHYSLCRKCFILVFKKKRQSKRCKRGVPKSNFYLN